MNLNDPIDFSRLTMSPLATALQGFLPSAKDWDLIEGSYISNLSLQRNKGAKPQPLLILTPRGSYQAAMSEIRDVSGRRKVRIKYPYVDGQGTDDLGREGEEFEVRIILFGAGYLDAWKALKTELNQPSPGILQHPVMGQVSVSFLTADVVHSNEARKAVAISLRFIEHTFSLTSIATLAPTTKGSGLKTALLSAANFIKTIGAITDKVQAYVFKVRSYKQLIKQSLDAYNARFGSTLQRINFSFNSGTSLDLVSILPVSAGGNANADGTLAATTFPLLENLGSVSSSDDTAQSELAAVTPTQAATLVNETRVAAQSCIDLLKASEDGLGSLIFYDDILSILQSVVQLQEVLEQAVASSNALVSTFVVPRLMSVREVCFAIGIDVQRGIEIEQLNPSLLSVNYIEKGTSLTVPVQ